MLATLICSLVFYFIIFRFYLTFVKAVITILKHATLLRLSNLPRDLALTQAEQEYQTANIDERIRQLLTANSQVHSIQLFVSFLMATEIGWFILTSVALVAHQAFSTSGRSPSATSRSPRSTSRSPSAIS